MRNVTKTADLSEYTDDQIELMFQSAKTINVLKKIVESIKDPNFDSFVTDRARFDPEPPSRKISKLIKLMCENEKIDPKIFGL